MDELIAQIITALNARDLDGKFGNAEQMAGEDAIGIEFEGETYFLTVETA